MPPKGPQIDRLIEVERNAPQSDGGSSTKCPYIVSYEREDRSQLTMTDMDCSSMESTRYNSPGSSLPSR
jgi:hypothetical protein